MSRYAAAHVSPQGPGDARPTALQIVKDEGLGGKLTDKVMVITGGSAGIGVDTAKAFHATGAKLFLPVRNIEKGQKVKDSILSVDKSNNAEIILVKMELDSLDSVRAGAKEILSKTDRINVLVNNAGVAAMPEGRTKDGFETQFGTNHVAHFLLFQLLKPTLLKSSSRTFQSRVVCISSTVHRWSPVRFDDYNFDKPSSYNGIQAYAQTKTCSIYLANEIERRYSSQGLHGITLDPGFFKSNLQAQFGASFGPVEESAALNAIEKSTQQGAATTAYAALSRDWEGKGGVYLSNCAIMGPFKADNPMNVDDDGYAPYAYDAASEGRLWKDSLKMVGLEDDQ